MAVEVPDIHCSARWLSTWPLSRNVAVKKSDVRGKLVAVKVAMNHTVRPTFDTSATAGKQETAGMLARARIPAVTGTPVLGRDSSRRRHNLNSKNASNCRICVEKL
jgi:hypothetical protein